ncbi:hypothetical protein D3C73_990980 [compost metagenome]
MTGPDPVVIAHVIAGQCTHVGEQRVRRGAVGDLGFLEQGVVIDVGQAVPKVTDGQVDMAVDDFLFQQGGRQFSEVEVQPLMS